MSHSTRKPSGKRIVAYDRVCRERALAHGEFPRKMITIVKWDDIKVLISKKPLHENIGTVVVSVKEGSRKAIA